MNNEVEPKITIKAQVLEERSQILIANFVNGFAAGWIMAVGEWFKDRLDIKLTKRKINKKEQLVWTQGRLFNFREGDCIYDTKKAYDSWEDHLRYGILSVQIHSATPNEYINTETIETIDNELNIVHNNKAKKVEGLIINKDRLKKGVVRFKVYRPNKEKTAVKPHEYIECTQDEFVCFLQTGIVTNKYIVDPFLTDYTE
jgi:hypothetical protein